MQRITTRADMRRYGAVNAGKIGFVPTMGYLHEGHLSLVERAKAENERVVVSIFVNPAQFNDPNDLEKYPVDLERDAAMLVAAGVDALFCPVRSEIYPRGVPQLLMSYPGIMQRLCGAHRAGHFEGVLLIVHNLLQWVNPARAYFGLKDYQQYLLIKKMALDLEFAGEIIGCPLIREEGGLAMSSRNVRLTPQGRKQALAISRAIFLAADLYREGKPAPQVQSALVENLKPLQVEYAELCNADTLEPLAAERPATALIAVAAFVDGVRLIDNIWLK